MIYSNIFNDNTINAEDNGRNNKWNNDYMGNYWNDYDGKDRDNNGIGDTPFIIPGTSGSIDELPILDLEILWENDLSNDINPFFIIFIRVILSLQAIALIGLYIIIKNNKKKKKEQILDQLDLALNEDINEGRQFDEGGYILLQNEAINRYHNSTNNNLGNSRITIDLNSQSYETTLEEIPEEIINIEEEIRKIRELRKTRNEDLEPIINESELNIVIYHPIPMSQEFLD